ncbi:MAG TPA: T9SS type A sorting domain-containing protein, partial [Bacteroidales bacterium]|nr:T9SS type A sorting domain-containing protein [Bacteroidales bacterium]
STAGITDINIAEPMTINGACIFTNGVVYYTGIGSLTFGNSATSNIGNANSYVNGIISKTGTSAFIFATGEGENWGPCAIAAPASNSTISAQYVHSAGPLNWTAAYMCSGSGMHHTSGVEHWNLSSDASTPNVTLYWNANSGVVEPNDLVISHYNSSTNCWENKGVANMTGTVNSGNLTNSIPFTSYSPITIGTTSATNPLPVELASFVAECDNNNNVQLYWETASEINNDYFEIQRSTDDLAWEVIANIQGAGFSNTTLNYDYLDKENPNANTYYRLRQVDYDGTAKFSDIISINCGNRMEQPIVSVYPNPFNSTLNIEFENWDLNYAEIELLDITSRTIQKWNLKNTLPNFVHEVNLSDLHPAMYMLRIKTSSGVIVKKVEKE